MRDMTISIVQSDIEAAVANYVQHLNTSNQALPLEMTAGRAGKGFTASLVLNQDLIEKAIIRAAQATFVGDYDYSVELSATRGDDGFTGVIKATAKGYIKEPQVEAPAASTDAAQITHTEPEVTQAVVREDPPFDTEETVAVEPEPVAPVRTGIFGSLDRPSNEAQ